MGETRVDLLHLLEDLRDAYTGPTEETILTEVVANALDSGATLVDISVDPARAILNVVDNGSGMTRRELARYHDLAATTKTRGQGIGFAGVGIKLGLLVCREVITETRRGKSHVASSWRLASRHRAPWRWVEPEGLVADHGTAVRLMVSNSLSLLLDPGFLESTLTRHFATLLDPAFDEILAPHYRHGVSFRVNGRVLERHAVNHAERAPLAVRLARKRKPAAIGYIERSDASLPEDRQGVAISTFGKVIKRGWEWLGVMPSAPERVGGRIEAPPLSATLTLNKADFIRSGARGATYLAFRKAIQEAVTRQLAIWGDDRRAEPPRPAPVRLRELEQVLEQLASDFPLLGALVEQRRGGQRRLPWRSTSIESDESAYAVAGLPVLTAGETETGTSSPGAARPKEPEGTPAEPERERPHAPQQPEENAAVDLPQRAGAKRPGRYGLHVDFDSRPGDPELARLVETTIRINVAHPAYRRALVSRSLGYHIGISVALALAPLAADKNREHQFLTTFLARWGETVDGPRRRGRR